MADREEEERSGAGEAEEAGAVVAGEEEDTGAQVAPIIRLEEVAVSTGEENEHVLVERKAKLYRFDQDAKMWKERGVGTAKILKHKESNKYRVLMRQNKTLKICANHYLSSGMNLQEHAGSDKSWVWHAMDFSDGEVKNELLCIRFSSVDDAQRFKEFFEEGIESQAPRTDEEKSDAADAAELLGKLKVKDISSEPTKEPVKDDAAAKEESKTEEKTPKAATE